MKKFSILVGLGTVIIATTGTAHDTATPYSSRGACEAASAAMSNGEKDWLLETFPQFFDTAGEASSFLTRAWTCDRNVSDGQWYISDHVEETLASEWFAQRNH